MVFSRSLFRWRTTLLTEIAERKQSAHLLEAQMLSEQAIRSEAQRLQLAESESRSRLEDAVAEYLSFTKTVSQGDLSKRLVSTYDGALGQLGEGLNGMVTNLHTMTAQVQEATNAITAAAVQILASTVQQAAAATEQSTTITEATTSVEEVKTVAQQTANQASKVAEDSQTAQQIAQQGAQVVRETLEGMAQIRQQVDTIAPTIEALASHSQEVGVVIATLSELADEINKLASNAAIASTRQSEVDQEDLMSMSRLARRLADQTQTTTEEVRRLLSEIQQGTRLSVEVTKTGINKVEASSRLMEQAGEAMQYMASEIEQGAQVNIQIAAAARQQMIGMEQIGQAMVGIQQATTQALAGTRETEHAAQSLNNLAQSLQEAVTAYQL
jgi:methyl-accepting chemotaxis protein